MKPTFLLFIGLLITPSSAEYREWTDAKSGTTITAKPIQKSMAKDRIELRLENGKVVWIDIARLSQIDKDYAINWARDEDLISTKVLRFGKKHRRSWKDIQVKAQGGTTGGTVVLSSYPNQEFPRTYTLKPGETAIYEFRGRDTWVVEFIYNKALLDSENGNTKTGKTIR